MVVEHVFVTTLEGSDALRRAAEFLAAHGFVSAEHVGFQVGQPQWTSLEMRRGKTSAAKAVGVQELPQSVRLEFDRGRVVVAASIEGPRTSFRTGVESELRPDSPKSRPHVELLMTIAAALEQLLAHQRPIDVVSAVLTSLDVRLASEGQKRRRRRVIVLWVVIGFVGAMIGMAVAAAAGLFR